MANEPVVHVIDDDDAARHSLSFLLECAAFRVRSYESAVSFLKAVPSMEHGCIVTDVRMPEMSGVELIGRLRALAFPDPVIVITGHADVPLAIQAMKAGVVDFIEKPFSDEVILTAVRAALTRQTDRDQARADRDRVAIRGPWNSSAKRTSGWRFRPDGHWSSPSARS